MSGLSGGASDEVQVLPTKALFVEMLTRDLMLDRAVLDLVDNSIDGARRLRPCPGSDLSGLRIDITLGRNGFSIDDNCGGIGLDLARTYAFRIGRSKSRPRTPNAIGEFGVGMKRALFKFGHEFTVTSRTLNDRFKLVVDVDAWEADDDNWSFRFEDFEDGLQTPEKDIGTLVEVSQLRDNVADTFDLLTFQNNLAREIARGQQEYLDRGLLITFNNVSCPSSPWTLLSSGELSPVSRMDTIKVGNEDVHTRIFAGISAPNPKLAGWYVFCNGRMVLEANQSDVTGWGRLAEEEAMAAPKYHNQFARFRGYAFFDAANAGLLPWNTTKTGVDEDAALYRSTLLVMVECMRTVLEFLRRLDDERDIVEAADRVLTKAVAQAQPLKVREITQSVPFRAPVRRERTGPQLVSVQFRKPRDQVAALQEALDARSASEVGGMAFDLALQRHVPA